MRSPAPAHPYVALAAIDFLGRDDATAALLPTAERLARLTRDLLARVPAPLRGAIELTAPSTSSVVLNVASASTAAKLRQSLPSLQEALAASGWNVDALRIRVRPRASAPAPVPRPAHAGMPTAAVDAFDRLGRSLDASPLRTAVEALVARRGDRR